MRDPRIYLKDILTAMGAIEAFVRGMEEYKNREIKQVLRTDNYMTRIRR